MTVGWTYGAEHEWADHPLSRDLPPGYGRDVRDVTIVNSNGIANDPKGISYGFGGEINTPPTDTIQGQVDCLSELKAHLPEARINYRSNLHLHIRVPGLSGHLDKLKGLQAHIHAHMPALLTVIEPLPRPTTGGHGVYVDSPPRELEIFKGAIRRWRRRRVSHQTLLTAQRLEGQMAARTLTEFFQAEVPVSKAGKPLWHFQPRLCVNVRQLLETDTIEFRHFPGTMNETVLKTCLSWCRDYLSTALAGESPYGLVELYKDKIFPPFPRYVHWMEERYRLTCHDHSMKRDEIERNIAQILEEDGS